MGREHRELGGGGEDRFHPEKSKKVLRRRLSMRTSLDKQCILRKMSCLPGHSFENIGDYSKHYVVQC